jgi:hypothetical protein
MDAEIKQVKKRLREVASQRETLDYDLRAICLDIANFMSILKTKIQQAQHRKYLLSIYNEFLTDFQTASNNIIRD